MDDFHERNTDQRTAGKNQFDRADWNGPLNLNKAEIKPTEC